MAAIANDSLPAGWRSASLEEIAVINPGRPGLAPSPDDTFPTTFVPMSAVDERTGTIRAPLLRPFAEVAKGYVPFTRGDVLFAKITPCMQNGKHAVVRDLSGAVGFSSTEFHVLRPGPKVLSEWIHLYVRRPEILALAERSFTGSAGQQRVPTSFLRSLPIPLPPLERQREILSHLLKHLAAVEVASAGAEVQVAWAMSLRMAVIARAFESTGARDWPRRRLGSLTKTCSGLTPHRGRPDYFGGQIPWVKTAELVDGPVLETEESVTEMAVSETGLRVLPPGTLLVAMYGQGKTRGRTGILGSAATTNQACFAILPKPTAFSAEFLQLWFRYKYRELRDLTEGRGGSQPNLNGEILRNLEVPLPPLRVQVRVVQETEAELCHIERVQRSLKEQVQSIAALPASLLRRAFRGEL